jgi:hypothetical protein
MKATALAKAEGVSSLEPSILAQERTFLILVNWGRHISCLRDIP